MRHFFLLITRNILGFLGCALTTASAVLILCLFGIQQLGYRGGPYLGIVTFLILPMLFVSGLLMIPLGMVLEKRRSRLAFARGEPEPSLPVIDLNRGRTRRLVLSFVGLSMVNLVILSLATYKGVEVMDSPEFCGNACHTVMSPEYTTYQRSAHARVPCVSCHIGPGADWFVKSKLSGSWQLIAVSFNLYPRPIGAPVHSLRPARETCEQCHWPTKFVGDRFRVMTHYAGDEANTERKTVLLLKVGGKQQPASQGIHWHVDPSIQIRYRSDRTRETIGTVELRRADGTVELYEPGADAAPAEGAGQGSPKEDKGEWRVMDCVDCHNRPAHIYRMPADEIDAALEQKRIDRTLPFIKREGLKALQASYVSHEEAREKIAKAIASFYSTSYPHVWTEKRQAAEASAKALGDIYCTNVFPWMKVTWGSYPNHLGHQNTAGCWRCHDEMHKTASGKTIPQDCSICHSLLANDEENPAILQQLNP